MPPIPVRVAAVLFWVNGVGLGLPAMLAIRNLSQHKEIPLVFGFPAYGGGWFERRGIKTTIGLLVAFLVVNILEVAAGGLLWSGARSGAILGFRTASGRRDLLAGLRSAVPAAHRYCPHCLCHSQLERPSMTRFDGQADPA